PGELAAAVGDPRGWLKAQLQVPPALPVALAGLPTSQEIGRELSRKQAGLGAPQRTTRAALQPGASAGAAAAPDALAKQTAFLQGLAKKGRDLYVKEASARTMAQVESDRPLVERLVVFWANHFTVSILKPIVTGLAGPFEREAIRPHVLGRFHDMLLAV